MVAAGAGPEAVRGQVLDMGRAPATCSHGVLWCQSLGIPMMLFLGICSQMSQTPLQWFPFILRAMEGVHQTLEGHGMVRGLARNVQVYNPPNSGDVGWTLPLAGAAAPRVCAPLAGMRPPEPEREGKTRRRQAQVWAGQERAGPGEGRPRRGQAQGRAGPGEVLLNFQEMTLRGNGYLSLEYRREVWIGNSSLEVTNL
ncbi:uncharacterized protein LOC106730891 isoform X4 [Camelus ferus]|uniref:Uncharacterized protein LOC106730891 isoform X4 n=1 Tax=Camelus ferus TaxID=419612 RepID=A0A8B8SZ85_CAMFR|nr:uncharacterized protein LOC106730891 isoform X4 [Camelus ferus]